MPLPTYPPKHPPKDNGIEPSFAQIEGLREKRGLAILERTLRGEISHSTGERNQLCGLRGI